jgi:8-hydroxy-5-deazaflavin:NADPH oxidoreductase
MKLGIIGAGNVGAALAKASVRASHEVVLASAVEGEAKRAASGKDHLVEIREVGATAAASNKEAVQDAEIVILAVPFEAVNAIVGELGSELDRKVLIDVTNRFSADQLDGTSNAELTHGNGPTCEGCQGVQHDPRRAPVRP